MDTLALGSKNPVLGKFDADKMLTEVDQLLNNFQEQEMTPQMI